MDLVPVAVALFLPCISAVYRATEPWPILVVLCYVPLLALCGETARYARTTLDSALWLLLNVIVVVCTATAALVWLRRHWVHASYTAL